MAAKRKFKNDAFEAIHSSASAMYKVGAIDKATMRSFDASCLASPPRLNRNRSKSCGSVFVSASRSSPVTSIPANQRLRSGRPERSSRAGWRSSSSRLLRNMVWKRWPETNP